MSEELLHEQTQTEAAVTMADLEEHFDDANPWNVVKSYMEKGTILPVKVEGIVNGGAIAMIEGIRGFNSCIQIISFLYRRSGNISVKRY